MKDVAATIIKLNINRKDETSTFNLKGAEKCNQIMVKNATPTATRSPAAPVN
jgi:hypothetical protein